jgi:hypothetical protein
MTLICSSSWFQSVLVGLGLVCGLTAGSLRADLAAYGVFKGENYFQDDAGAPGAGQLDDYGIQAFAVSTPEASPFLIFAWPQGDLAIPLALQSLDGGPGWFGEGEYVTASGRDDSFPDGEVRFQVMGFTSSVDATMTLTTPDLPPIPAVANYAETQAIDPEQSFTLQWNSFVGGGAQDAIWVRIDSFEGLLFSTPMPGAPGALTGTATQVVIPAGTFSEQESISATVGFFKVGAQTTGSLPDSTALAGSYRSTTVEFTLLDDGGNGGPTDGPTLVSTAPANGAMNVNPDTQVRFDFSRPMAPTVDITWLANGIELSASSFDYAWSADAFSLTATYQQSFPANSIIVWDLGGGFEDATGAPLEGEETSGFFMTSAGNGNGDCEEGDPFDEEGNFGITRVLLFEQSGPGTVAPAEEGAIFAAVFNPPDGLAVTAASFTPPSAEPISLQSFFGSSFFSVDVFANETELNAVYPLGNYAARVEPTGGTAIQMTVSVSGTSVPTPELINYTAGQAIDPSAPFTLTWNSFTGADTSSFINLEIADVEGDTVFSAPNECIGLELAPTATSITVPADTMQPGKNYDLTLSFYRITDMGEHAASEITFLAAQGVSTQITLRTIGGTIGDDYRFNEARIGAGGRFQATVTGTAGTLIAVESTANWVDWDLVTSSTVPGGGSLSFEDPNPPAPGSQRFYRVRAL